MSTRLYLTAMLACAASTDEATAQNISTSWTAATNLTAWAQGFRGLPDNNNSVAAGTSLDAGRIFGAGVGYAAEAWITVYNQYSQSSSPGCTSHRVTSIATVHPGHFYGFHRGNIGGDTLLAYTGSPAATGLLSVELKQTSGGPAPGSTATASIDISNNGSIEWQATAAGTWQFNAALTPGLHIRIGTAMTVATGNHLSDAYTLDVRFTAGVNLVGAGSPTAAGTPRIDASGGAPRIGNTAFAITGSNFLASSLVAMLLTAGPAIPAPGVAVPNAQPGCNLHVGLPHDICAVMAADASGRATFPLGIPADPYLVGLQVGTQWLAADLSLPYPLAIGSSPALSLQIGN